MNSTDQPSATTQRPWSWQRSCFPALVLLGLLDRLHLLLRFGSRYVGTDDSIIWQGASDYARLIFHEPYFYGQDYNPMLEALLAAPFIAMGLVHWFVLPTITCLLSLAPYWAFGAWHQRQGRHFYAAAFAAMPLLLSTEYAISTMITRGFVSGLAMLVFWPWVAGLSHQLRRSMAAGLVLSSAIFMNPNAAPLVVALGLSFLLEQRDKARALGGILLGTLPFAIASRAAQAWFKAHPDHVWHSLYDWRMIFHPEGMLEGAGNVGHLFHALGPWPIPGATWILAGVVVLLFLLVKLRDSSAVLALLAGCAVVVLSWGFAKVHDGEANAFYPIWRMFMALPLLLLWASTRSPASCISSKWPLLFLLAWTAASFFNRSVHMARTVLEGVAMAPGQVLEQDLATLWKDAIVIKELCDEQDVDAIICLDRWRPGDSQFPAYLYPVLIQDLPPTYLPHKDRRQWQRATLGRGHGMRSLVLGGTAAQWERAVARAPTILTLAMDPLGSAHLVPASELSTDSLLVVLFQE